MNSQDEIDGLTTNLAVEIQFEINEQITDGGSMNFQSLTNKLAIEAEIIRTSQPGKLLYPHALRIAALACRIAQLTQLNEKEA